MHRIFGTLPHKALVAACTVAACACNGAQDLEIAGHTMGTTYTVKVVGARAVREERELKRRVDAALERVDSQMSTYREDSEISRFNRAPVGEWFSVSVETERVVSHALALARSTGGAFDVTAGALVNLWGFGPDRDFDVPREEQIARARERVGWNFLQARASPPALKKTADIYVDLSAIAKGFGVDQVARVLESWSVDNYLVEVGGELRVLGRNARGDPWRVGVQVPQTLAVGAALQAFHLDRGAVATSGDYFDFHERDGRRYSHTIDPRTGHPVRHALASVTVLAPTAMEADALATALNVLGPDDGMRYATRHGIGALFIIRSGGALEERATPQFAELRAGTKH